MLFVYLINVHRTAHEHSEQSVRNVRPLLVNVTQRHNTISNQLCLYHDDDYKSKMDPFVDYVVPMLTNSEFIAAFLLLQTNENIFFISSFQFPHFIYFFCGQSGSWKLHAFNVIFVFFLFTFISLYAPPLANSSYLSPSLLHHCDCCLGNPWLLPQPHQASVPSVLIGPTRWTGAPSHGTAWWSRRSWLPPRTRYVLCALRFVRDSFQPDSVICRSLTLTTDTVLSPNVLGWVGDEPKGRQFTNPLTPEGVLWHKDDQILLYFTWEGGMTSDLKSSI